MLTYHDTIDAAAELEIKRTNAQFGTEMWYAWAERVAMAWTLMLAGKSYARAAKDAAGYAI
ncbi:hypothetical protein SAMN06265338_11527 [Rhodoblastus acidophilus]|uniref:Uncharacterized protein n=1 Tax=Rhodoblastus acidophilus TaxID=1074 RepID=A0A212S7P9_RHOAC|nr:hypothetical protein [Rhodoblastus acidophilus]SNB81371.1 hypothetical protein SAMN06265338_11527 [Rhodoblastus acidophilus]